MTGLLRTLLWPSVVLLIHVINTIFGLYWKLDRLDNLMHFLGGASIAASWLAFASLLQSKDHLNIKSKWLNILLAIGITALAAVLWEFMEFGMDYFFGVVMQPDLTDTMSDLALGLLGALVVALFKRQKR